MNIVLVAPSTPNPAPTYYGPPNALALFGAMLKERNHNVAAYDWSRETLEEMYAQIPKMIERDKPQLVGISGQSSKPSNVKSNNAAVAENDGNSVVISSIGLSLLGFLVFLAYSSISAQAICSTAPCVRKVAETSSMATQTSSTRESRSRER